MADSNKHISKVLKASYNLDAEFVKGADKRLLALYRESLDEVQAKISKMYEKYGEGVTISDMKKKTTVRRNGKDYRITRLEKLEFEIKEQITVLTRQTRNVTADTVKQVFKENYNHVGYAVESGLNIKSSFQALNPDVIRSSINNPVTAVQWPKRIKTHAEVLNTQVSQSITKGLIQGTGYKKQATQFRKAMRTEIKGSFESYAGQIDTIVRTESHRAQSAGRLLGMDKTEAAAERLGLESTREWLPVGDSRTRKEHMAMKGQIAKEINGEMVFSFPSGGTTTAPGLSGIAKQDINDRCTVTIKFPDLPARYSTTDTDGNKIYHDYPDWGKKKKIDVGYKE